MVYISNERMKHVVSDVWRVPMSQILVLVYPKTVTISHSWDLFYILVGSWTSAQFFLASVYDFLGQVTCHDKCRQAEKHWLNYSLSVFCHLFWRFIKSNAVVNCVRAKNAVFNNREYLSENNIFVARLETDKKVKRFHEGVGEKKKTIVVTFVEFLYKGAPGFGAWFLCYPFFFLLCSHEIAFSFRKRLVGSHIRSLFSVQFLTLLFEPGILYSFTSRPRFQVRWLFQSSMLFFIYSHAHCTHIF
jgi:hypothetical protein